jgi:hypothetical protein
MMNRLTGAIIRASLMVLLIITPSILLPGGSAESNQTVALVALLAAIFTLVEYNSTYPSLVEFRDAPPFNRLRYVALFATVLMLAVILQADAQSSTLARLFELIGMRIAEMLDFPYSPVRLMILMLPPSADAAAVADMRTAAGLAYLISLISLAFFVLLVRVGRWPSRRAAFNVWVNMPTFDPTAGRDVVHRLSRDSQINLILGFLLPFLIPAMVKMASDIFDPISLADPHTLIWTVTAWAFLPASLVMRGVALARVAQMIETQRKGPGAQGLQHA